MSKNKTKTMSNSSSNKLTTIEICISAILIAIAFVLSTYVPALSLPQGGSLTFCSMLFISLIGYFFGPKVGLTSALAYGLLQLILKPSIIHPVQLILDYPLAFSCLGVSGFFASKKHGLTKGYIIGVIGRYICHVLSGIVFFSEYASGNVIIYSLLYNLTYILPEMILTLILIPFLMKSIIKLKGILRN